MIFIVESTVVEPGTEEKLNVPTGTKVVYWSWQGEKQSDGSYVAYGAIGKGLTPEASISDLIRIYQLYPKVGGRGNHV